MLKSNFCVGVCYDAFAFFEIKQGKNNTFFSIQLGDKGTGRGGNFNIDPFFGLDISSPLNGGQVLPCMYFSPKTLFV